MLTSALQIDTQQMNRGNSETLSNAIANKYHRAIRHGIDRSGMIPQHLVIISGDLCFDRLGLNVPIEEVRFSPNTRQDQVKEYNVAVGEPLYFLAERLYFHSEPAAR